MYKLFMALRYLRAHRIIYFSVAGVAIGIMTIVVVTSIMGGFRRDMRARIRGMQAHIIVRSADTSAWIPNYEPLISEISAVPGVIGCAPRIEYKAWLGHGGRRREVTLVGIDPERERQVSELADYFVEGRKRNFDFKYDSGDAPAKPGLVLGSEVLRVPGIGEVSLLTARDAGTFPMLCHMTFEPVGRFSSRMVEYDSGYVITHLFAAQDLLKVAKPMSANLLAVSVDDFDAHGMEVMGAVIRALHRFEAKRGRSCSGFGHIKGYCGKYRVMNWMQIKAVLLAAVEQERAIMIIVLFFIVLVAGFNISSIYTLVVRAKAKDIGIMRALGATEGGVTSIFLASGGLCGIIGSAFGVALGLLIAFKEVTAGDSKPPRLSGEMGPELWVGGSALVAHDSWRPAASLEDALRRDGSVVGGWVGVVLGFEDGSRRPFVWSFYWDAERTRWQLIGLSVNNVLEPATRPPI